ncbi:tyrosine-protein kinase receptor TYRO3-like [Styela clava]
MDNFGSVNIAIHAFILCFFICNGKAQRLSIAYHPTSGATWDISLTAQRMRCGVRGPRSTVVDWYKDGKRITGNMRVWIAKPDYIDGVIISYIIFKTLYKSDEAVYACKAHNSRGNAQSRPATLTIRGPPGVNMQSSSPEIIAVSWHEQFSIPCVGKGPPDVDKVVWNYKGFKSSAVHKPVEILYGTQHKPVRFPSLTALPREDDAMANNILFYEVFCVVHNRRGSANSTKTRINIKRKPGIPTVHEIVSSSGGANASVFWKISSNGFDRITSCSLQLHSKPDFIKSFSLQISSRSGMNEKVLTDLTPVTDYTFIVKCSNSIGASDWSKEYSFTTAEGFPDRPPGDVTVTPVSESRLEVSWLPVPEVHVNGILRGYKVKLLHGNGGHEARKLTTVDPTKTTFNFYDLSPGKAFCARVLAFTNVGDGPLSTSSCAATLNPAPLDPPIIENVKPGRGQVTVTYRDGNNRQGQLQNCTIIIQDSAKINQQHRLDVQLQNGPVENTIRSLLPNAAYSVTMRCNSVNEVSVLSNTKYFRTLEEKPKYAPRSLTLSEHNHALVASWSSIDNSRLNGNFTGYNICISFKLVKCYDSVKATNFSFANVEAQGVYTVEVAACTNAGCGPFQYKTFIMSSWTTITPVTVNTTNVAMTPSPNKDEKSVVVIVCIIIGILLILFGVIFISLRKFRARKASNTNNSPTVVYTPANGRMAVGEYDEVPNLSRSNANTLNPYSTPLLADSSMLSPETMTKLEKFKFGRERLRIFKVLGEGEFGCVYKGKFEPFDTDEPTGSDGTIDVAVKTMKMNEFDASEREEFVKEGLRMKDMDHPHVMKLIGICLPEDGSNTNGNNQIRLSGFEAVSPLVVLPFMINGDLRSYLYLARNTNDVKDLTLNRLLHFIHDIASGMEYLTMKNIIHRDLACRNCMLDEKMRVVVSDFGLSRQIYSSNYYRQRRVAKMPVKWMALESLVDRIYTTMTDVWSFGVTAWEVFTFCQNPYPGVANHEMHELLKAGTRLKQPKGCPNDVWNDAIFPCWDPRPDERPTFIELVDMLADFIKAYPADYQASEASAASYVNVLPPDPYEKLSSHTDPLLNKVRSNTVSSSHNEVPMPYETAVACGTTKNGNSQSRDRSSSKRPLLRMHEDDDELPSDNHSPRVSYL